MIGVRISGYNTLVGVELGSLLETYHKQRALVPVLRQGGQSTPTSTHRGWLGASHSPSMASLLLLATPTAGINFFKTLIIMIMINSWYLNTSTESLGLC